MKLLQRMSRWANSWSVSQLIFLYAWLAVFMAFCLYQTVVIHQLAERLKGLP